MAEEQQQPLRVVILATHCPSNSVETLYAHSLADTIKRCLFNGITIMPLFINDTPSAIVAKNELLAIANGQDYESIVFVDHNIAWDPQSFLTIVNSTHDAAVLPVTKKLGSGMVFDLDIGETPAVQDDNGYIKVSYASTSLFKLSNKLVAELSDSSLSITNPTGNEVKNVFDIDTKNGQFVNESRVLCNKIQDLGYDIWLNPVSTCANIADNVYALDFAQSLAQTSMPVSEETKALYS